MENGLRPESGGKVALTRLEKLLYRLEAQHAVLAWAFEQIAAREGIVFELGLGKGRTYDHLCRHLPGRQIWVFEREVDAIPDCVPNPAFLIEGKSPRPCRPLPRASAARWCSPIATSAPSIMSGISPWRKW